VETFSLNHKEAVNVTALSAKIFLPGGNQMVRPKGQVLLAG